MPRALRVWDCDGVKFPELYSSESAVGETWSYSDILRWELDNTKGFVSTEFRAGRGVLLLLDSTDVGEVYLEGNGMDGELSGVS